MRSQRRGRKAALPGLGTYPAQGALAIQEAENSSSVQKLELATLLPCHWGLRGAERSIS